jgi:hypothetical protein
LVIRIAASHPALAARDRKRGSRVIVLGDGVSDQHEVDVRGNGLLAAARDHAVARLELAHDAAGIQADPVTGDRGFSGVLEAAGDGRGPFRVTVGDDDASAVARENAHC